jgi:hypothetical protein
MAKATVQFTDPKEIDFPTIDQMRRSGKVVTVAFPHAPENSPKLASFIQDSIRKGAMGI